MTSALAKLSPREYQVAALLALGYTNIEAAGQLAISVRTVEIHRANMMDKLGADSRADVVRWAFENELLP